MTWEVAALASFVFAARLLDVTLATLRHVLVVRGLRLAASGLALLESLVWILAVSKALKHTDQPTIAVAFALGFATGTLVGMTLERYLGLGEQVVRVFTTQGTAVADVLRSAGHRVTRFEGAGRDGPVDLLFIQAPRRIVAGLMKQVRGLDPASFCVVDDVRAVEHAK